MNINGPTVAIFEFPSNLKKLFWLKSIMPSTTSLGETWKWTVKVVVCGSWWLWNSPIALGKKNVVLNWLLPFVDRSDRPTDSSHFNFLYFYSDYEELQRF